MVELKQDERLDDLERNGYKIIQNPNKFCFGMDAVLLSGFANVKKGEKVLDMGTGTGIIPILLEAKTKGSHFTGLEIQEESADMARRSVAYNHLEEKIDILFSECQKRANDLLESRVAFVMANDFLEDENMKYTYERLFILYNYLHRCTEKISTEEFAFMHHELMTI